MKNISKNIFLYNLRYRTFIILWFNWVSFHIRPRWTILRGKKFTKTVQTARWRRLYQKTYMMNERFEIIFWRSIANAIFWMSLILILLKFNVLSFKNGHLGITSRQHKPKRISKPNIFDLFNIKKTIIFKFLIKNILDIDALHTFSNPKRNV